MASASPNELENLSKTGPRATISKGPIIYRPSNSSETLSRDGQVGGVHGGTSGADNNEQIDIEAVAIGIGETMKRKLTDIKPVLKSWTIYKVPSNLKYAYGSTSFEPKLMGIGFYHYYLRFGAMSAHKWRFFYRFLNSMNKTSNTTASESSSTGHVSTYSKEIECLFGALKKIEASTRACYSEDLDYRFLSSPTFIETMMVDGCFIIELLRLCEKLGKENIEDPLISSRWTIPDLRHDLLMLENQIPFHVLETLFDMSTSSGNANQPQQSLKYLILKFLNPLLPREDKVLDHVLTVVKDRKPHHLLDFFRSSFNTKTDSTHINVGPSTSNNEDQDLQILIHNVTELKEAGIEFKKRENHNLLDIKFKNGKLYIPPLLVDENTSSVFLNFLVYEQCNQFLEPYFTNYLMFLDCLVDSSTDVEHLHCKGIIDHVLSSDEKVAELFNKLCKDAVHDLGDNYLSKVLKDVNRYTGRRWNTWRAAWKHTYFKNPWAFSSFLAAVFLLILTTIQTFFSVYAYIAPPS